MNKITHFIALFALISISLNGFGQNIQLRSNLTYPGVPLANIGGYVDTTGIEYALVGTFNGLDIVDVSDPVNPVIRFSVPGIASEWREVKTYRKFAYITTEGGGGLTIVDMSNLPATIVYHNYTGDGAIAGQLDAIHALHCDTAKGFLYLYGSSGLFQGSSLFLDLTDPYNPTFAGHYEYAVSPYVHDGYVLNDTMYESHINGGFFTIVDVTDKANPVLLATQTTPTAFTHNTWLSNDHKTLFTTDENSSSFLTAYDITDPANIQELSRFQTAPGSGAIIHNTHILNDYAITSWYKEGVVITDVSRPKNPIEVGHYDTYPQGSGNGFNGCWGVYPFLPSGNIVASDIDNGLFVLTPTYVRGCYLEGNVTDSISGALIGGATLTIVGNPQSITSDFNGDYATGTAIAGHYDLTISKPGYYSKTITGINLANGVVTNVNVQLAPLPTFAFSGQATDSLSSQGIPGAVVTITNATLNYNATADGSGNFTFPGIVPGTYDMIAGSWGYKTICTSVNITSATTLNALLPRGYYDDFSFDFGWTVAGTSPNAWERGEPYGTQDGNGVQINPEVDASTDCGENCFVTDNVGIPYNSHDVDNGYTILYSPLFDGTIYTNPTISYYRWFICNNGLGTPNDSMVISVINGTDSVLLEMIDPNDPSNGSWVSHSSPLTGLIALTSNMQLVVRVFDNAPGNIVEGGIDQFQVTGQLNVGMNEVNSAHSFSVYPNPFTNYISISSATGNYNNSTKVIIKELSGRVIRRQTLTSDHLYTGDLSAGVYILELQNGEKSEVVRITKITGK